MGKNQRITNGEEIYSCPMQETWETAESKISEIHQVMTQLVEHVEQLSVITLTLKESKDTLKELKQDLISAATGKAHVPVLVVHKIVNIFGWVILILMSTIVFLLTGKYFHFIN